LPHLSQETLLARKQFSATDRPIGRPVLTRRALDAPRNRIIVSPQHLNTSTPLSTIEIVQAYSAFELHVIALECA